MKEKALADPQSLNKTKYVCQVLWRRELSAKLPSDVTLAVTSDNLHLIKATGDQIKMPVKKIMDFSGF